MNATLASATDKRTVPVAFNSIAGTYDLLTGSNPGYHRHLRRSAERLGAQDGDHILDLCCGTGSSTAALRATYPNATLVGLDGSEGMLDIARTKPELHAHFVLGDATDPAAAGVEGPFDGILTAYGIRNLSDPDRALKNLLALLRPGGRLCVHEYSVADSTRARVMWDMVSWGIIIPGGLLTAPRSPIYRYLWRSVRQFDGVEALVSRMERAGFVDVQHHDMGGWQKGILHSFVGHAPG